MERFTIEPSEKTPGEWVVTDTKNGIICTFEEGRFNDTQSITTTANKIATLSVMELARVMRELGEWVFAHHKEKAI